MNLAMAQLADCSGISRQYFKVEIEGSRDYAYNATVSTGEASRTYELNFGDEWSAHLLADGASGFFGPPRAPWLRTNVNGQVLSIAR
ncbi:hypothetical protein BH10PSE17_BH10PSE17_26830 [soil metagenome]